MYVCQFHQQDSLFVLVPLSCGLDLSVFERGLGVEQIQDTGQGRLFASVVHVVYEYSLLLSHAKGFRHHGHLQLRFHIAGGS